MRGMSRPDSMHTIRQVAHIFLDAASTVSPGDAVHERAKLISAAMTRLNEVDGFRVDVDEVTGAVNLDATNVAYGVLLDLIVLIRLAIDATAASHQLIIAQVREEVDRLVAESAESWL